ncbi:unnamed protein product [Rotaria magnacalcarata]|uniref:Pentatricopeptide repeat-containing protein n=1 Tax=Rotaria magnacalcarata TaxID=392030 RepID=A0A816C157_9BILA|nr:unnamed protein product [Rotaria magnacalcarata]
MLSNFLSNTFKIQAVINNTLMECKDIDNAMHIFSSITKKSNYMYTVMFKGLITNNVAEKVLDLFDEMKIEPDQFNLSTLFNACAVLNNNRAKKTGKKLLDEMRENYRNNNITSTSAIDMLMKFGDVENAERIFRSIKAKDIIAYGAMMKGYVGNEMFEKALDLFEQIDIELNDVTHTIVFNACAKLGNDRAMKIGKELLAKMPENYRNDSITSTSGIDMLMKFGDVESAERIFRSIKAKGAKIYGALMNGYNLNGESWKCFKIFEEMKEKDIIPDEIEWNILVGACSKINAFALNGMGSQAVELYREMPNNLRNHVSQICVLNACSHAGLLHEARTIFNEISLKTESIITTMVDCLSRLFMFDEAQKLIEDYEKTNTPSIVMYS